MVDEQSNQETAFFKAYIYTLNDNNRFSQLSE
jgi:hypothetical protein